MGRPVYNQGHLDRRNLSEIGSEARPRPLFPTVKSGMGCVELYEGMCYGTRDMTEVDKPHDLRTKHGGGLGYLYKYFSC